MSTAHPASVWMRAGPLTWASLTGDRELLYQAAFGVAVVVGVKTHQYRRCPKKICEKAGRVELLKECFGPMPHLPEESSREKIHKIQPEHEPLQEELGC